VGKNQVKLEEIKQRVNKPFALYLSSPQSIN